MKYFVALASIAVSIYVGMHVYQYALEQAKTSGPPPKPDPIAVETACPALHTVEDRAALVGVLEAGAEVQLVARTSGYIVDLPYDVGDVVRQGDIIVRLDDSQQRENVATAKAALTIAEAQLRAKQAEVNLAQTVVDRERELSKASATSIQQLEAAEGQLQVGKAQLELEQARVSEALSRLEQSQLLLKEMQILAPTTGVVAERHVDIGDLAKNDIPLLRIVEIDRVRTLVRVVERDYSKLAVNQTAQIETDAFPKTVFRGRVVRKAPVIDPASGTAEVQIEIPNQQHLLKPGMHARASILFQKREQAMVIPASALLEARRFPAVMIVSGDPPTAEIRQIEVGVNNGEIVEVVSGLAASDRVVTVGSRLIGEGSVVNPQHQPWDTELIAAESEPPADDTKYPVAAE